MSKLLDVTATCPKCGTTYPAKLFRTIWGENESNRRMVMEDRINILECPHCHHKLHAPMAMMYVDVEKKFAVWWEPMYDSEIDEMTAGFRSMMGPGNYYETAPRITDWEEFKATINKYYSGELRGQSEEATKRQQQAMAGTLSNLLKDMEREKKKQSGCLSSIVLFITAVSATTFGIIYLL